MFFALLVPATAQHARFPNWRFCRIAQVPDVTGTIEPGKSADFIVINQNILEVPVEKIHKTRVLKTVLQGHTVYEAK